MSIEKGGSPEPDNKEVFELLSEKPKSQESVIKELSSAGTLKEVLGFSIFLMGEKCFVISVSYRTY